MESRSPKDEAGNGGLFKGGSASAIGGFLGREVRGEGAGSEVAGSGKREPDHVAKGMRGDSPSSVSDVIVPNQQANLPTDPIAD